MTKISASTEIYGVFGYPAKHSLSPLLHNAWIDDFGFNAVYLGFEVKPDDFEGALSGLQKIGLKGANITAPLKENIAKLAQYPSLEVSEIGAANTIRAKGNSFEAFNTDGGGLVMDLDYNSKNWRETTKIITIIGTGGAARGAINALLIDGITEIRIVGRCIDKANKIAELGKRLCTNNTIDFTPFSWENISDALNGAGLVINATTLGLNGNGKLEPDFSPTNSDAIIYDMVYMPTPTEFTNMAKSQNRHALNGMGMLVGQGAIAFEYWFCQKPSFSLGLERLKAHFAK